MMPHEVECKHIATDRHEMVINRQNYGSPYIFKCKYCRLHYSADEMLRFINAAMLVSLEEARGLRNILTKEKVALKDKAWAIQMLSRVVKVLEPQPSGLILEDKDQGGGVIFPGRL